LEIVAITNQWSYTSSSTTKSICLTPKPTVMEELINKELEGLDETDINFFKSFKHRITTMGVLYAAKIFKKFIQADFNNQTTMIATLFAGATFTVKYDYPEEYKEIITLLGLKEIEE
jgi:hypothetical protein